MRAGSHERRAPRPQLLRGFGLRRLTTWCHRRGVVLTVEPVKRPRAS
jgi:hypothetical protein